jgi:hypothetical protein
LGERLLCKQEVIGSIPFTSTTGAFGAVPDRDHGFAWARLGAPWPSFFDMVKREVSV